MGTGFPGGSMQRIHLPMQMEPQEMQVRSLDGEDLLKEEMGTPTLFLPG